ncbi:TPA: glycoside-pentoside-hexuronide (GPH):cation symporter [Klebsiella pneumoniae]
MSQAIQYNSSVAMIRHPRFLQRAADLTPALQRLRQTPQAIVEAVAEPGALNGWRGNTVCTPEQFYQQPLNVGDSIIIDFGSHFVGYLQFSCRSVGSPPDAPAHLHFTFGETLSEVCEPFSEYQGWLSSSWLQQQDLWLDVLPARVALPRRYCLRYLKVEVKALSRKFRLQFDEIALETVTSAGSPHPAVIADPQLKAIDDVAVRTLKNCMQEVFEDGPKRDRRLWLGDLRLQAQVNDVTFGHHDLVRRCLYLFAAHTREDGMVSANVFVQPEVRADDTFLFDYSLFFVDVLYNYLQSTGDTETVGELWPTARRQIELALTRCDSQGLVRDSDDWWVFIDWQAELNKQASAQGVLIYCLQRALWLAQRFEPQRVPDYTATLWQLKEAALHHLWDNERQVFISGAVRQVSWASQIWLVLAEVGTAGKLLYAFVTYLCLSFLYTLVNIPFCAMLPFLTSDSAERTTLSAVRILLGSLGATIVAVATLPLVGMLGKGNQQQGFLYTAVIFGVLAAFFLLVSFRNVEEKITLTGERMTLKRAWISLRANRPWWVFASNIFLMWGAFFFQTGALVYFFHYYVGNTELTAVIAGISTFVPLLGTLTVPLLARRMKKRHVYLVASAVNLLGMGIMMVSGAHVLGLIVGAVILSLGAGQRTAIYFSMQADPVDYGVWKTGINTAGILTSINGFLGKVAMAGAGAITGVLLSSSGYIANHTQSDSALLAIKACYLYIPALLILASMLWMGRFYRLDDQYEQIRADLDAGRGASPAPAPTAGESPAM